MADSSNSSQCSQNDYWWSEGAMNSKMETIDNYSGNMLVRKTEQENLLQNNLSTEAQAENEVDVKIGVFESKSINKNLGENKPGDLIKEIKSNIKRPSGAQRRKRKWMRLDISSDIYKIQTDFKKLEINDRENISSFHENGTHSSDRGQIKKKSGSEKKIYANQKKRISNFDHSEPLGHGGGRQKVRSRQNGKPNNDSIQNQFKGNYGSDQEHANLDQENHNRTTYSSALKNKLDVVIFDESNLEGTISCDQSNIIVDKLLTKLSDSMFTPNCKVPRFEGYHLNKAVLTITCADESALEWLMNVNLGDLWDGAKIKTMRANEFARLVRLIAFVPGPERDNFEILKLLKTQNDDLNIGRWKIYHRSEASSAGVTLVLGVDEKSLQVLKSLDMKPYYGMSRMTFRLPDNQTKQSRSC